MFVYRDWRGPAPGTAQRLLDTAMEWARGKGIREIFLGTTAKFLAAHRFFEKNGFAEIAKAALPAAFPIMAVDTRFFHRPV
jgi:N-acetylglutamate synthase-like GNAT family acetyltransferase